MHNKKSKKKLTTVSFAFTHTYTLEKLTLLLFFPKRTWKILKNVQNAKEKNISLSHVIYASFPPSFFVPFPYVILDIPEVPAFKKRAQVFCGGSLYNECFPFDLKSAIIECDGSKPSY